MSKPRKVRIETSGVVANERSAPNERVIEFDGPTGTGGLIAFRSYDDGSVFVEFLHLDPAVFVAVDGVEVYASQRSAWSAWRYREGKP